VPHSSIPSPDPRVRRLRRIVLSIAVFVIFSLVTGMVFAVYNFATDRPVKELFGQGEG